MLVRWARVVSGPSYIDISYIENGSIYRCHIEKNPTVDSNDQPRLVCGGTESYKIELLGALND